MVNAPNPPDILKKIIQRKMETLLVKKQQLSLQHLQEKLKHASSSRGFIRAIKHRINVGEIAVIAEIKKASPSGGVLRDNFNPVEIAKSYEKNSATCFSILTEVDFFQGADEYLQQVRIASSLPILRKDFIIDPYQVYESKLIGADCILLIVAVLSDEQLQTFSQLAQQLKMDVLVEVHTEGELKRALELDVELIGINNRDLHSFDTDLQTTLMLLPKIPQDKIVVTESGINNRDDLQLMRKNHVNVFLIGETLMRETDPGKKLAELIAN